MYWFILNLLDIGCVVMSVYDKKIKEIGEGERGRAYKSYVTGFLDISYFVC